MVAVMAAISAAPGVTGPSVGRDITLNHNGPGKNNNCSCSLTTPASGSALSTFGPGHAVLAVSNVTTAATAADFNAT